jgi:ADP-ribose pyrophosphatase
MVRRNQPILIILSTAAKTGKPDAEPPLAASRDRRRGLGSPRILRRLHGRRGANLAASLQQIAHYQIHMNRPAQAMIQSPDDGRVLFSGLRFQVVELHQQTADGRSLPREAIIHPGAVVIVPMVDRDRVCLIRNERVAVGRTLIELPAGTLDREEPPRTTAVRELQEETGFTAKRWHELPGFFMSPGILCERMHVFVAEDLTAGAPAREMGENIDNLCVSWAEALAMVDRGEIEDAKTICGLLMWERRRPMASSAPHAAGGPLPGGVGERRD